MANQPWYKESNRLAQENKILKELMISMADPLPPDGDTGRHKPDPNAPGSSPWRPGKSPAPSRPNIMAGLRINPNTILLPKEPKEPETDEDYGEGEVGDGWKLAHGEGRGPQPKYHDEYNQPLKIPPWMQMDPSGKLIEIPWMKEQYMKEHPELASGPDYIGDKLRYGQLDRILNPLGNFQKPTLDQLRIHKNAYPKV